MGKQARNNRKADADANKGPPTPFKPTAKSWRCGECSKHFVTWAELRSGAIAHYQNLIDTLQYHRAVCNDNDCCAFGFDAANGLDQFALALVIEVRVGLV